MALTKVTSTFIDTISTAQILKSGATAGDILSFDGPSNTWKPKTPATGGTVTSVALSSDGTLQISRPAITNSGTIGVSISSVGLEKLARGGATDGQALRWDNSTNTWKAAALPLTTGTVTNVAANCSDSSLTITGSPISTTGTIGISINNVNLDKLSKTGAAIGNLIAYNGTAWAVNNTLYIASNRVGLGTTSPTQLLTVNGNIDNTGGTLYAGAINEKVLSPTINVTTGIVDLDIGAATVFNITLTRSIVKFNLLNKPTSGVVNATLILKQDSVGSRTVSWTFNGGETIQWSQGAVPVMTTTANKTDIYSLFSPTFGASWYGFVGGISF
jgi:hypothetical protein